MGRQDRERYEREKAAYKGPWKVPDIKDPLEPKKPMSAFLAFANERRRAVANANPLWTGSEISSFLSKLWKECPAQVKKGYQDRVAQQREQFKRDHAKWEREKEHSQSEAESSSVSDNHSTTSLQNTVCDREDPRKRANLTASASFQEQTHTPTSLRFQPPPLPSTLPYGPLTQVGGRPGFLPNISFPASSSETARQSIAFEGLLRSLQSNEAFPLTSGLLLSASTQAAASRQSDDPPNQAVSSAMQALDHQHLPRHDFTVPPLAAPEYLPVAPLPPPTTTASSSLGFDVSFNMGLPQEHIVISNPTRMGERSRFENYSMDDILQSEELFEDFSPSHVAGANHSSDTGAPSLQQRPPHQQQGGPPSSFC